MFTKMITAIASLAISSFAHAGAANAEITCVSDSGKTKIEAYIPGDMLEAGIALTVEGQTLSRINRAFEDDSKLNNYDLSKSYPNYEIATIATVTDFSNKVLTLHVLDKKYDYTEILLIGIPETFKVTSKGYDTSATFRAKLTSKDPRDSKKYLRDVSLSCKYHYSL
ncbi:hypothetical protein [Bdellovibrio sp. HCB209]|uniref:hypothetical protein n=1 Tax=Bdellovibrio sp. HCB209 TaxID=3394354 RepID=UPI0039B5FAE3